VLFPQDCSGLSGNLKRLFVESFPNRSVRGAACGQSNAS
jgi:hypothetical protein